MRKLKENVPNKQIKAYTKHNLLTKKHNLIAHKEQGPIILSFLILQNNKKTQIKKNHI